jgi:hypothetical protein
MSILGYMSSSTRANASGGATAGGAYLLSGEWHVVSCHGGGGRGGGR